MWWLITAVAVVLALLIQYMCSHKILQLKQKVSSKSMNLREARSEGERLGEMSIELKSQDVKLKKSIRQLRTDIRRIIPTLDEQGAQLPKADFSLEDELREET